MVDKLRKVVITDADHNLGVGIVKTRSVVIIEESMVRDGDLSIREGHQAKGVAGIGILAETGIKFAVSIETRRKETRGKLVAPGAKIE